MIISNFQRSFLSLALAGVACLLAACTPEPIVRQVTLDNLVAESASFAGSQVRTEGVVRTFPTPRHYWLEDGHHNRVGLPAEPRISAQLGRRLQVTGTFHADTEQGRWLEVDTLVTLPPR